MSSGESLLTEVEATRPNACDILTGGGLGLLAGLLIGLSVSPVVASVVSGLVAVLGAVFGLQQTGGHGQRPWRIAAFGIAAAVAVLVGLTVRTHDLLSPSIGDRVVELERAGYPKEQARSLAALQNFGVVPGGASLVQADKAPRTATSSALFAATAQECGALAHDQWANTAERLGGFKRADGAWQKVAAAADAVPEARRDAVLEASWQLACNH